MDGDGGYKNECHHPSDEDCLSERDASSLQITQNQFLHQMFTLPKQMMMTLDEKYLRHCLELIHMTQNSSKLNRLPLTFASRRILGGDAFFLFSSQEPPIVGSITGCKSMKNLLNSHLLLLQQQQPQNEDINRSEVDIQNKRLVPADQVVDCDYDVSNSIFSDPSSSCSSSSSTLYSQGMLHCSWNNGFPRYVFSVEDHTQVYSYTTSLSKIENNYVYRFYSQAGKRENEILDDDSDLVGRMRVSTSFTPSPLGTQITETQFILCGTGHQAEDATHTLNQTVKKNRGLSKKVSNIFKGSHFNSRHRTSSKFDGSVVVQENSLHSNEEGNVFSDSSFCPNLELAAIVVKDHIPYTQKKIEVGGWGLKFLKDDGLKQNISIPEPCRKNGSSMDVVIPAGLHGGPNGGPCSLIERWRGGGFCDCGGWDIGCPLTVLNARSNSKDVIYQTGVFGKSNSFELFTQGCKQSLPVIEVMNVRDGLYYIHYQSSVSALQCLSIAVAIIHSHSPTLKPKYI